MSPKPNEKYAYINDKGKAACSGSSIILATQHVEIRRIKGKPTLTNKETPISIN
jgi:hypothetical protein